MVNVNDQIFKQIANELRDLNNWIAVFSNEYDLPAEVVEELRSKIESISKKLGVEAMD